MSGKMARKYFLGQGVPRLGCAQAVAEALREPFGLTEELTSSMAAATGGRAPAGYCGAVYAALCVARDKAPHKKEEIEDFFKREAGGITCRDIRSRRRLLCADCVEKAANLLSSPTGGKGEL